MREKQNCGFCKKFRLNGVNLFLIVLICIIVYISHQLEMKEYRAKKAQQTAQKRQNLDQPKTFETLQEECFFKQNQQACDTLNTIIKAQP